MKEHCDVFLGGKLGSDAHFNRRIKRKIGRSLTLAVRRNQAFVGAKLLNNPPQAVLKNFRESTVYLANSWYNKFQELMLQVLFPMISPNSRCRSSRRGLALVEFALVLPVVLSILLGIIEMGFLIKNQLMLSNAVREGARYAALGKTSTQVRTRIKNEAGLLNPKLTDAQIVLERSLDPTATAPVYSSWPGDDGIKNGVPAGNLIRIRVSYPHRTLTGFFPFFENRPLNVAVTMLREAN